MAEKIYNLKYRGQRQKISMKALTKVNDDMAASFRHSTPEKRRRILDIFLNLNMAYLKSPPGTFSDPMDLEDWFSVFKYMLPQALMNYEPSRGHIMQYIIGWKRASFSKWQDSKDAIRLPSNQRMALQKLHRRKQDNERRGGRPGDGITEAEQAFMDSASFRTVSLSSKSDEDGDMLDTLVGDDPRATAGNALDGNLWAVVKKHLKPAEYDVWRWRFHPDYLFTYELISQRLGLTRERVRQKINIIREKLKKPMRDHITAGGCKVEEWY